MKHRRIEICAPACLCFRLRCSPRWCGFCGAPFPGARCGTAFWDCAPPSSRWWGCGHGITRRQVSLFADDLCETLDALLSGRQPENYQPYEDSLTAKVQGKLMQYFDIMSEGKRQSQQDKQVIQSLVSDISHQVKTPDRQHQDVHQHPAAAPAPAGKAGGISAHHGGPDR